MTEEATTAEELLGDAPVAPAAAAEPVRRVKKGRRTVTQGHAHIKCSYNNTIVSLTDRQGQVLAWSSAGIMGFKGAKKATPYAAGQIVRDAAEKARKYQLKEIDILVSGVGSGREAAIRALAANDFTILSIKDVTPAPHNGCRPPRARRV